MGVAALCFIAFSTTETRSERIFYYINAAIALVATIAHFTMGSNLGWSPIQVKFLRKNPRIHGQYRDISTGISLFLFQLTHPKVTTGRE